MVFPAAADVNEATQTLNNAFSREGEILMKVKEWLATNGMAFLVNLIAFLIILFVGKFLVNWACRIVRASISRPKNVSKLMENFIVNVVHKLLWVLVLLVGAGRFGLEIGPFVAGLGVTGFIVGFAFQDALGNLASGMMIALNTPFHLGDLVETGGHVGSVVEMNMMATTLTTPDNKKVVVPNKSVWGSPIVNYTALGTRRVDLTAGIAYGEDIGKAQAAILAAVTACEGVLAEPVVTVEVVEMADSSVNFVVRPWCNSADYWNVFFAANRAIKEGLDAAGVEIPFPQMDVHFDTPPTQA
jgi:small conductance mechanosensitive channel